MLHTTKNKTSFIKTQTIFFLIKIYSLSVRVRKVNQESSLCKKRLFYLSITAELPAAQLRTNCWSPPPRPPPPLLSVWTTHYTSFSGTRTTLPGYTNNKSLHIVLKGKHTHKKSHLCITNQPALHGILRLAERFLQILKQALRALHLTLERRHLHKHNHLHGYSGCEWQFMSANDLDTVYGYVRVCLDHTQLTHLLVCVICLCVQFPLQLLLLSLQPTHLPPQLRQLSKGLGI